MAGWRELARTEWGRRAMPGEFFFVMFLERILSIFFVSYQCREGKDGGHRPQEEEDGGRWQGPRGRRTMVGKFFTLFLFVTKIINN